MQKASKALVKELKKQKRENDFLLFLDNYKIIKDAITSGQKPLIALVTKDYCGIEFDCPTFVAEESILKELVGVKTPQNVCIMTEYTQPTVETPKSHFLVLDELQDPGNVGTLIRSALASGMERVFIISGVKPTNPKLVRSSAGAIFNIPVHSMERAEFCKFASDNKLNLVCTDMKGESIFNFSPNSAVGIVIGNEGNGASSEIRSLCKKTITIPMKSGIESLNAAVSGSIVMFELTKNKI